MDCALKVWYNPCASAAVIPVLNPAAVRQLTFLAGPFY